MAIKLLCIDCTNSLSPNASPVLPSQELTPAFEELPQLPNFNLDGAFYIPLRHKHSNVSSRSRPATAGSKRPSAVPEKPTEPVPPIPKEYQREIGQLERPAISEDPEKVDPPTPIPLTKKAVKKIPETKEEFPKHRRTASFKRPKIDMVSGRTPSTAWQAVAAKVVAANRMRKGLMREITIEDFKIEELGGRAGPLVFGPVAVFNGNVTMKVKKPIQRATVTITFQGITEIDKILSPFISTTRTLYAGDLQDGIRSFLFGFNFPHVNLPPTSENPKVAYSFIAKISLENLSQSPSETSLASLRRSHEPSEYKSKPLRMIFIPYIDPALETPLVSRKPSMRRKKSRDRNGFKSKSVSETPSAHTLMLPETSTPPIDTPKVHKPKLTLTTADLPLSASSNSTPVIDKPHPSRLSSAITRSTRITDDENETLAKLTVEMPSSRFLPGGEIALKVTLQVRDGFQMPKGLGARVVETRYLASEVENKKVDDEKEDTEEGKDEDDAKFKMKSVGKEQHRVLTGKRFMIHPEGVTPIRKDSTSGQTSKDKKLDTGLAGGKEVIEMMKVTLPPFKTFISESLLPSAALPLGNPNSVQDMLIPTSISTTTSSPTMSLPKIHINGNGNGSGPSAASKGKSSQSSSVHEPHAIKIQELYFKVSHMVQITIPLQSAPNGGGGHWYSSITGSPAEDLEVSVPIILGNKNPAHVTKYRTPELRLNAPESLRSHPNNNGEGSSTGTRSHSGSNGSTVGWRDGDRFLNLRETETRPNFVLDQY